MIKKNEQVYSGKITKKDEIDSPPPTQDSIISKLQTIHQSNLEYNLSSSESTDFPSKTSTLFSSNREEDNSKLSSSKTNTTSHIKLTQKVILNSFSSKNTTLILQKILSELSKEELDDVVNELIGKYRQIIKDKNGNYFCSELFKVCIQDQRIIILKELSNTICDDCVDEFGSHTIQNSIDFSSCEEEYNLILKSFNDYYKLAIVSVDTYGSYVIKKIISHIPEKYRMKFNSLYVEIICLISTKQNGGINAKLFVLSIKNDLIIRKLMDSIKTNFVNLALNYYGKYLIINIIDKWWKENEGEEIKELIRENIGELSSNSNGSYIIGHYFKLVNKEEKNQLISNLYINFCNNRINKDNFMEIMKNLEKLCYDINIKNNIFLIIFLINNNQNILSYNILDNNNNIFNNNNQMPLLLNNFGCNNNIINTNQLPLSLNNFGNNNNFTNSNQIPFSLNNNGNNNMRNNLPINNFNQKDIYSKNNNKSNKRK
jgi:hypothetical protein